MAKKEKEKETKNLPSTHVNYGEDAGTGFENQTQDDYSLPFLNVVQPLTPELEQDEFKKLQKGDFLNSVTKEFWSGKDGVTFVPCHTDHVFVEWVPRDSGGGFVAVHQLDSQVVAQAKAESEKFGKYKVKDNDLVETYYIYGILYHGAMPGEIIVIPFTSTKITAYKKYNTRMNTCTVQTPDGHKVRPPLFAHRIKLTTEKVTKDNNTWWNVQFSPAVNSNLMESLLNPGEEKDADIFNQAKAARELVMSGNAKVNYESQTQDTTETHSDTDGAKTEGKSAF